MPVSTEAERSASSPVFARKVPPLRLERGPQYGGLRSCVPAPGSATPSSAAPVARFRNELRRTGPVDRPPSNVRRRGASSSQCPGVRRSSIADGVVRRRGAASPSRWSNYSSAVSFKDAAPPLLASPVPAVAGIVAAGGNHAFRPPPPMPPARLAPRSRADHRLARQGGAAQGYRGGRPHQIGPVYAEAPRRSSARPRPARWIVYA